MLHLYDIPILQIKKQVYFFLDHAVSGWLPGLQVHGPLGQMASIISHYPSPSKSLILNIPFVTTFQSEEENGAVGREGVATRHRSDKERVTWGWVRILSFL